MIRLANGLTACLISDPSPIEDESDNSEDDDSSTEEETEDETDDDSDNNDDINSSSSEGSDESEIEKLVKLQGLKLYFKIIHFVLRLLVHFLSGLEVLVILKKFQA